MLPRKILLFDIFALIMAGVFVRLGFWQLHRLDERRARNSIISAHLGGPPIPIRDISRDTAAAHYRKLTVTGVADSAAEFILIAKSLNETPGVDIVTPVHIDGAPDLTLLVLRGWVFANDAATIDVSKFEPAHDATYTGYVEELPDGPAEKTSAKAPRSVRLLNSDNVRALVSTPTLPFYLVATGDTVREPGGGVVIPIGMPTVDEGPHMSYAIQWFAFAIVGLIGAGIFTARSMQPNTSGPPASPELPS